MSMFFPDFDALLEEEQHEEILDAAYDDGYQRRQQIMEQVRQEISGLPQDVKDAFWEGWYS